MWQRFYIVIITNTFLVWQRSSSASVSTKQFYSLIQKICTSWNYLLVLHSFISVHVINTLQYFQINQIKTNNIFNTSQTILSFFCFIFFVCAKKLRDNDELLKDFFRVRMVFVLERLSSGAHPRMFISWDRVLPTGGSTRSKRVSANESWERY